MADLKKLAEELVNLTVKDVKELADILKEEYGIEPAAAAVAVAAPAAGGEGAAAAAGHPAHGRADKGARRGVQAGVCRHRAVAPRGRRDGSDGEPRRGVLRPLGAPLRAVFRREHRRRRRAACLLLRQQDI